ncbi:NADPH-dependent oxidoreductase [Rhizobium rhizogenes]|uniref:NADPH-dependent oxidoreductase n=1 Tax=Rhizobium rhizogenes TaxID=359 RepID=UPI0004DA94DD|nr:NADPH-dependent oxidoreductase [Rhizobium rhizogenes]OCJ18623.1 NADPH-dependent oxidoreductase [Agrobacterium sp. B131/95]KEA03347.1 nitroreductase [Rhizobium rhizogenes]MDJ1634369.1 NADPH-dependent oxidoreductase [Rhizobium rhizogenes]MQB32717.1 NADPH-dependent oxidoreductase [Rhizobium rhizogenes]NTF70616.1 NADPH-dependent oxidoreductase [Rhizobium rhizogenes]
MTSLAPVRTEEDDRLTVLATERYRNGQRLSGDWNETLDTLLSHRSVRNYLPKAVPDSVLHLAIAAAQSAPSSSNLQAWSVVAVKDEARKSRLNTVAGTQRQITQAPLLLIWLADLNRPRNIAAEGGSSAEGLDYVESFLLGVIDAALAAQNAVSALESQGLGTCYIGAIRNDPEVVARELELPEGVFPVFGLTVGYPDPAVPAGVKPRLPQTTVLHREHYDTTPRPEDLRDYNAALGSFQAEQSLPLADWTELVKNRIGTVEALKGRHLLGAAVRKLGFKLK